MALTSISSLLLLLLIFFQISFLPLASASEDTTTDIERQNADPFYTPDVVPQPEPLEIIPGITKALLIKLKGQEEEIVFSFRADEADPSVFESSVLINDKIETTQVSQFLSQETLALSLDYEAGQCSVSGDKGLLLKSAIHEQNYQIDVVNDKGVGSQEKQIVDPLVSNNEQNKTFVISATAGACVVVALVVKVGMTARRRRKSVILGDLPARCNTDEDLAKKGDCNSAVMTQGDCEGEDTYKGYIESLTDVPLKNVDAEAVKTPPKKLTPKSQVSTACTLGVVAPPPKFKKSPGGTHVKFTDEDTPETVDTDREHKCKIAAMKPKSKPQIKKQPFKEEQVHDRPELSLDLDLDLDLDRDPRRAPTVKEIKALVKKMEEEGTIGYDCDPSAESDDEDQYEAPVLPNYFCCMLCFQGRRCTIVQPCRHIFSCTDCVEDLLKSYKICVLCANEITGYEPL